MSTSIKVGSWSTGIASLISAQKLNEAQLRQAVDSALGELEQKGQTVYSAKAGVKLTKNPDKENMFKLTEKQASKFNGVLNSPLRLYFFNQQMVELETIVGSVDLNGWPQHLINWVTKFS